MSGKRYAVIPARSLDETAAPAEGPTVHHHRGAAATSRPAFARARYVAADQWRTFNARDAGRLASPSRAW
jgi:hypothetical protein